MQNIFQRFVDELNDSRDPSGLQSAMAGVADAMELPCFAYLRMPQRSEARADLISTYPAAWTNHYLSLHYEQIDPIICRAHEVSEPFEWGLNISGEGLTRMQEQFFEEASAFGIRCGFTIPIRDDGGTLAAVTFASDVGRPSFKRAIETNARVLQLVAISLHAHARRRLYVSLADPRFKLTGRELECLQWAAEGKSRWDTGQILGVSAWTVKFHLENAKKKLRVRTVAQAICLLERGLVS